MLEVNETSFIGHSRDSVHEFFKSTITGHLVQECSMSRKSVWNSVEVLLLVIDAL